jgi:hypothetical protein
MTFFLPKPVCTVIFWVVSTRVRCNNRDLSSAPAFLLKGNAKNRLPTFLADKARDFLDVAAWQLACIRHKVLVRQIPAIPIGSARA